MPSPQYNSPLQFPQESGVVEALQNDLTLRASTSGDVVISPNALRPEVDVAQDLGTNNLRWHTLHLGNLAATSGTFGVRPTISGIGFATLADIIDTQITLNGLSGAISITSPDNTILIGDGPQAIELSGLFTPASGAVLEQKCADIDTLSGLILSDGGQTSINDESGVISLLGGDGITIVTTTEGSPGVPAEITISALFTAASGAVLQQKCEDIASVSGTVAGLPEKVALEFTDTSGTSFVMYHGLSTLNFTWNMWEQDDGGNIQNYVLPATLRPSGVDYVEVGLSAAMVGTLIILG
tara:strand:+ start:7087 stop:7977 length:891 start_codon:yes stop_codon:yes gene_type:complete